MSSVDQPVDLLVVEGFVGAEGDAIRALFELRLERCSAGGQLAIRREQVALGEAGDVGGPFGIVVVAANAHELARRPAGTGVQDVRLAAGDAGCSQRGDVTVAAMLAQQRCGVPQLAERVVGPWQRTVRGEQRAPFQRRRHGGASSQRRHFGNVQFAERPSQCNDRSVEPRRQRCLWRRETPKHRESLSPLVRERSCRTSP